MADILTQTVMQKMWPCGDQHIPGLIEGMVSTAPAVFQKYGVTTPLVVALMMAQFSEECGAGLVSIRLGEGGVNAFSAPPCWSRDTRRSDSSTCGHFLYKRIIAGKIR